MNALIQFAGKQYKIEQNESIKVPRINEKVGTKVTIDTILYFDDGKKKTVGTPYVEGKNVDGEIISHGRSRKIVVFNFKRRKGFQKKNSHREEFTILKFGKFRTLKKQESKKNTNSKSVEKDTKINGKV